MDRELALSHRLHVTGSATPSGRESHDGLSCYHGSSLRRGPMIAEELSVVIPTVDPGALDATSIGRLERDPLCGEILVIINGPAAALAHPAANPGKLRFLLQPKAGLSAARNVGLREASREIVAFLDDDAEPWDGWCGALMRPFLSRDDVAAAGGPAVAEEDREFPGWLDAESLGYLGLGPPSTTEGEAANWQYPWGCNFAVRRTPAIRVGGFREDLGYSGTRLVANEETELFRRLQLAGFRIWCSSAAVVTHHVREDRLRLRYLVARAFWQGASDRITVTLHPDAPVASRVRCAVLAFRWTAAAGFRLAQGKRAAACAHLLRSIRSVGSLLG